MDQNEKRPKRPRISSMPSQRPESIRENFNRGFDRYGNADSRYQQPRREHFEDSPRAPRPYQPRYNAGNNGGTGYQPRSNSYAPSNNGFDGQQRHQGNRYNRYNGMGHDGGTQRNEGYRPRFNRNGEENATHEPRQFNNGGYHRPAGNGIGHQNTSRGTYNNGGNFRPGSRQGQQVRPGKSFTPRPRPIIYDTPIPDPNEQIRLNKFMANSGICSRREADEYIKQGLVKVNGEVVTELGTKISHNDNVEFDEKLVALENKVYVLLNKPKDCVTTSDDPQGRITVLDLVKGACKQRIYPVGRLDRNTTGVLLLTNDGDLASKLTHPKFVKKKIYHVWTDRDITEEDMQRIADGIELEDGPIHADAISYANETDKNQAGIEIHSGQNRIVRRIFEKLGYHVTKLDRVYFAGLTKKNLPRGRWRYLTQQEVNLLKKGAFE